MPLPGAPGSILMSDGTGWLARDALVRRRWYPTIQGSDGVTGQTYTTREALYQRCGPLVLVSGRITLSAAGTMSPAGEVFIGNLPFSVSGVGDTRGAIPVSYFQNMNGSVTYLALQPMPTLKIARMVYSNGAGAGTYNLGTANITNNFDFIFGGAYLTDDPYITPNPTILLTTALANGQVYQGYSQTISASGGTSPYTFAVVSGSLPAGLSLASNGAISGTPTSAATANFTVRATDQGGFTGDQVYAITPAAPSITVSPATLPGGTVGTGYATWMSASGGQAPYTFSVTAGALAAGLTLRSDGYIYGTPTTAGTAWADIRATDANGFTGTQGGISCAIAANVYYTEILVVGGGGGGSFGSGGGGGGGTNYFGANLTVGSAYGITIGAGGARGTNTFPYETNRQGADGGATTMAGVVSEPGGGGGGCQGAADAAGIAGRPGASGGGGGGGCGGQNPGAGGGATRHQPGGAGYRSPAAVYTAGGGGGGQSGGGGAGFLHSTYGHGGQGGGGYWSSMSGVSVCYGAGGGGTGYDGAGAYGSGAGPTTAPTPNSGQGGSAYGPTAQGVAGAAGIVIIRYSGGKRGSGGSESSIGGYWTHIFTSNGTFVA